MPLRSLFKVLSFTGFEGVVEWPRGAVPGPGSSKPTKSGFAIGTPLWDWFKLPGAVVMTESHYEETNVSPPPVEGEDQTAPRGVSFGVYR
jgi:hypothetical protein